MKIYKLHNMIEKDDRDIDKGIDWFIGLCLVLIIISSLFIAIPGMRLTFTFLTSALIIYLAFKNPGFRFTKIVIALFFLTVLWAIYFNLIPY